MTQLEINERRRDGIVILDLTGKIIIGDGSRLLSAAVGRLIQSGERRIILNLAAVTSVDSSGIGELVSRHTTTRNAGGRLVLLNLPRKIRDLLTVTRLVDIFESYEDEESAVTSFQDETPE
jgi:anti-anti-sigma factor